MNLCCETRRLSAESRNSFEIPQQVAGAMNTARLAQADWTGTPLAARVVLLRELRRLLALHAHDLAAASAVPRSRPILEVLTAEVLPLAEACRFLERGLKKILAPRVLGRRGLPLWLAGVRSEVQREPFGVVLIIGPGNYPLLLPGVQLLQAVAAGNAVLLKPGAAGTDAARALTELMVQAGFDPRLVGLLPESTEAATAAIEAGPDKVLFTGSALTGQKILAHLAPRLIPATMELSGSDAVLIRADADMDLAVKALAFGLRLNHGETCLSPKRVFVAREIARELGAKLADALEQQGSRGSSLEQEDQGEVLPEAAGERLRPLLEEALESGAYFIAGGILKGGRIRTPVVLGRMSPSSRLLREDVFGPVLSLIPVADDQEAIERANDSPYGLGASIFTRDETIGRSLATLLRTGVVTLNDLIIPTADARLPFGGRKRSGFGVTRGMEGLLDLTTTKVVTVSRSRFRPAFEAPQPGDETLFESYLKLIHGRGVISRWAALVSLLRSLSGRRKIS
jgi:acyl-CoA reductase-like NAD-dependent aldehyde dehydrogenase